MIDIIFLDASGATQSVSVIDVDHSHTSLAEPTDSPVENGVDITDHIRPKQKEFSAQCFVSNSLLEAAATQMGGAVEVSTTVSATGGPGVAVTSFSTPVQRVKLVYEALVGLQEARKTCTIVTPLRRYESMCITSLSFPVTNSDGITFELQAREIRIATTQRNGNPAPRQTRGHRTTNGGTQPTTPAATTPRERAESVWHSLFD